MCSGKCDVLDTLCMMKHRTKEGSDRPEDLEKARVLYSDIQECFDIWKQRSGGILYQHKKIKEVNQWNQDFIKEHCNAFEIIKHEEKIPDTRKKSGYREKVTYTYKYWGKEYTAKELNKKGVYITTEIHINNLVEMIPYFPYIVTMHSHSDGKDIMYISDQSYVEEEYDTSLQYGHENMRDYYHKHLAELTREIVLNYFNPQGRENFEKIVFDSETGLGVVSKPIDDKFDVEWYWEDGVKKSHWTSPKIVDADKGIIKMHSTDLRMLGNTMSVYYVEQGEKKLFLE